MFYYRLITHSSFDDKGIIVYFLVSNDGLKDPNANFVQVSFEVFSQISHVWSGSPNSLSANGGQGCEGAGHKATVTGTITYRGRTYIDNQSHDYRRNRQPKNNNS